jgi:shikimate kinase
VKILFIGLMGSGKSILGKQLASRLSLVLVDLDEKIVLQEGRSIPQIFEDDGEKAFRALESASLVDVLASDKPQVIATGGGAILSAENRALMKEKGKVIWLDASAEILAARISGDSNRPLLNDVNPLNKMLKLTAQRNPLYAEIADLRIDTGKLTDKEAVAKIVAFLSE